jgi:hypothetical protein
MIMKLKDGTELLITEEQGKRAIQAIDSGISSIVVNDNWVRCDWIVVVKPGGRTEVEKIQSDRQIDRPNHRGENSENKERIRTMLLSKGLLN